MAEYIERESVYKIFRKWTQECAKSDDKELFNIVGDKFIEIENIPAADVRPDNYGRWIVGEPTSIGTYPIREPLKTLSDEKCSRITEPFFECAFYKN